MKQGVQNPDWAYYHYQWTLAWVYYHFYHLQARPNTTFYVDGAALALMIRMIVEDYANIRAGLPCKPWNRPINSIVNCAWPVIHLHPFWLF